MGSTLKGMLYHISVNIDPTDQGLLLRRSEEWIRKVEEMLGKV